MVEFSRVLLRELSRQVEETDDPIELVELSDDIVHLTNDKDCRIALTTRPVPCEVARLSAFASNACLVSSVALAEDRNWLGSEQCCSAGFITGESVEATSDELLCARDCSH